MRKDGPLRPISGTAIAVLLVLGGCAQVTETLQEASNDLGRFLGEESAPGKESAPGADLSRDDAGAPAESSTAREASSGNAVETAGRAPHEDVYQKALAARAAGTEKAAFKGFRAAAGKRHPAAAYEVGRAYLEGRGVKADKAKGTYWMDRSAAFGEARAQFFMAQAYANGDGIRQDQTKAAAYYTKAAVQGHAEAQYALGETFSTGRGVPKNLTWAARWYGKAAHQGLPEAQYAYGLVHARGLGLPIDRTEGYRWLLLAGRAGHERAEVVRHAIQTKMAPEMIQLAEVWADRFQARRESPFADPPTVMYVQQVLNDLGYEAGPVDGQPGRRTRDAVGSYLEKSGQPRSKHISPQLIDRLLAEQAKAP